MAPVNEKKILSLHRRSSSEDFITGMVQLNFKIFLGSNKIVTAKFRQGLPHPI